MTTAIDETLIDEQDSCVYVVRKWLPKQDATNLFNLLVTHLPGEEKEDSSSR